MVDVMISFHGSVVHHANALKHFLVDRGFSVFLSDNTDGTLEASQKISIHAATCKSFVPFINEQWCVSKECSFEFNIAVKKYFVKGSPKVVPIVIADQVTLEQYPSVDGLLCSSPGLRVRAQPIDDAFFEHLLIALHKEGIRPSHQPGQVPAVPDVVVAPADHHKSYEIFAIVNALWLLNHLHPTEHKQISSDWGGSTAATYVGGHLWVATNAGNIYKIAKDGNYTLKLEGWDVKALATIRNQIFAFLNDLWIIDPETVTYKSICGGWNTTVAAVGHKDFVWAITSAADLFKIDFDGGWTKISDGWAGSATPVLVSCGDHIYAFTGSELRKIEPSNGAHTVIAREWDPPVIAASNFGADSLLAVTKNGSMYLVHPHTGSRILIENGWQDTKILAAVTD